MILKVISVEREPNTTNCTKNILKYGETFV